MPLRLRLIAEGVYDASLNMAIDEVLLLGAADSPYDATLRFYGWEKPSCSIGYFQQVQVVARQIAAHKNATPIVRRLSGGGMVMHGQDVTFSLSAKIPNTWLTNDVKESYLYINEALIKSLKIAFPQIDYADCKNIKPTKRVSNERSCFVEPSCYDLMIGSRKVVGSSQRRIGSGLLHQSAVFLSDLERSKVMQFIAQGIAERFGFEICSEGLNAVEMTQATEIVKTRYAQDDWSFLLR